LKASSARKALPNFHLQPTAGFSEARQPSCLLTAISHGVTPAAIRGAVLRTLLAAAGAPLRSWRHEARRS
jgi:hypothetical protein